MAIMAITGIIANETIRGTGITENTGIIVKNKDINATNTGTDTDIIMDTTMDIHASTGIMDMIFNATIVATKIVINTIIKAIRTALAKATMMGIKAIRKIPNALTNIVKDRMKAQQRVLRIIKAFSVAMKMDLRRVLSPVKKNYDKYISKNPFGAFLRQCLNSEINYTTSRDLIEVKDY